MEGTEQISVKFKAVHPNAKLPFLGKAGDAAFDLHCVEDVSIEPGETKVISTGLMVADIQPVESFDGGNVFLWIVGRSGLASKGIFPIGGIIDSNYRGVIHVILHNSSKETVKFPACSRIASMLVMSRLPVKFDFSDTVVNTNRGNSGFGSTGI